MTPNPSRASESSSPQWFEYPVKAHPHYTDYGGIVWHGSYVCWLEETRVECLRSLGIEFSDFVAAGCDLPVVDLQIRYHYSIPHGQSAVVKARLRRPKGVRLEWDYRIESPDGRTLYATAQVTLVAVDRTKGRIMRRLPDYVDNALQQLSGSTKPPTISEDTP